jgi:glyoxylase-like metal-dependent hydrolase (beta-lactamase superfamily II)
MLTVSKFVFNPFQVNTYIVWDSVSKEAVIVDPGCSNHSEENELSHLVVEHDIKPKYMILTHSHIDHLLGCKFVKESFPVEFYVPEKDIPLFKNADKQAAAFGLTFNRPPMPNKYLSENLEIDFGNHKIQFLFTPGHSPGEYCLYFAKDKICITGDVLFKGSIGRTDLWGGNFEVLMKSIKDKILTLPNDTLLYPGHGDSTTVRDERETNPFLSEGN